MIYWQSLVVKWLWTRFNNDESDKACVNNGKSAKNKERVIHAGKKPQRSSPNQKNYSLVELILGEKHGTLHTPVVFCGFGHIYWRNPWWKIYIFVHCKWISSIPRGKGRRICFRNSPYRHAIFKNCYILL